MPATTVRRLAADILGVGMNKIRIAPEGVSQIQGSLTRSDVRGLIEKGIVSKAPNKGRASVRRTTRRGEGSKKGTSGSSKVRWMQKVRAQRKFLRLLLESGALEPSAKRSIYGKIKSGLFRSKAALLFYLKDGKLVPADYEIPKAQPQEATKEQPKVKAEPKKAKEEPKKGDKK